MIGHKHYNIIAWTVLSSFQTVHLLFPPCLFSQVPSLCSYRNGGGGLYAGHCSVAQSYHCPTAQSYSSHLLILCGPSQMQFGFHFCSYKEWLLHLLYASKLCSLLMSTLPVNSIGVLFPSVHFHASCSEIRWGGSINVCAPWVVKNQNPNQCLFKDIDT